MSNSVHIGKINTKLQRVFAGLGENIESADEWLGAAQTILKETHEKVQDRSSAAAGSILEIFQEIEKLRHKIDRVIDTYEHEFYEEDAESAIQETLTASLSEDVYSYMAGCVLSEAVYSLMSELQPEKADKTKADDISKFLDSEGLDFVYYQNMLKDEMKRLVEETDSAWQGRCCVEDLCQEFPDANIPMQICLVARGYDHNLSSDPNIKNYLSMRDVSPGVIPPIDDNKVLDATHAIFEALNENTESDVAGQECSIPIEKMSSFVKLAYNKGMQLRDIEGRGGDDMSPDAFLMKLRSVENGANPMMDFHVDGEGVVTFMEKKGDNFGILCDMDVAGDLLVEVGLKEKQVESSSKHHTAGEPEEVIEKQLNSIKQLVDHGLPEAYDGIVDWLHDFYPDFSWNPKGTKIEIQGLLSHSDFDKIAKDFEEKFNYDIKEDLIKALVEI